MKRPFLFLSILAFSACSSPENQAESSMADNDAVSQDPSVLLVSGPEIIFLWPDSISMEKMKAQDSESFYIGADDYSFYTSEAMRLADSLGIKNTVTHLPVLEFITRDQRHIHIDRRNDENKQWGTYVFNGIDPPEMKDMVMMTADTLTRYFKK